MKMKIKPGKIVIEQYVPIQMRPPDEIRDRYTIKIRIKRKLTPEIREILENRLTREFKITRMIKKMEIIRDEKIIIELEKILRSFSKRTRHR
jgi:hypothetical protein